MNIADKALLYREAARVLKPKAPFVIYDILQGPGGEVAYPTPWSRDGSHSHLVDLQSLRGLLTTAGFLIEAAHDWREAGLAWFERMRRAGADTVPPLGLHLLFGPVFKDMTRNMVKNLESARIVPTMLRATRR
jgi:hypothetical protein